MGQHPDSYFEDRYRHCTVSEAKGCPTDPPPVPSPPRFSHASQRAQPALALSLLQELGLSTAVYDPPQNPIPAAPEGGYDWARGAAVARAASRVLGFRAAGVITTGEGLKLAGDGARRQESSSLPPAVAVVAVIAPAEAAPSDGTAVVGGEGATPAGVGVMGGDETAAPASTAAVGEAERRSARVLEGEGEASAAAGAASGDKAEPQKAEGDSCGGRGKGEDPTTLVRELFLCAALLPLAGVKHKVKKGKLAAAAQSVVQVSLKVQTAFRIYTRLPMNIRGIRILCETTPGYPYLCKYTYTRYIP